MKTAISIPDVVYNRVEIVAKDLGMSRSEFYARAAERYLAELQQDDVVAAINATVDVGDDSDAWAAAAGRKMLSHVDDEW